MRILDLHQDRKGTIWVATQGGVDRFVQGHFAPVPAQPNSNVLARRFVEDSLGNLYATDSPRGISRIEDNHLVLLNSSLNLMDMVESPKQSSGSAVGKAFFASASRNWRRPAGPIDR